MLETLKTLCRLDGVSGDEDAVRDYLREQARPYADDIRTDALGNLIVFKRGGQGRRPQAAPGRPHGRGGGDRHPGHR